MGQALYRKYRTKTFDETVGQEHITDTLKNAIKQGRISHAYLFSGPRGVGKTSIARILAHEINGLPYTDDSEHLDIIEIDAASNRRIDEIRDLRERVHVAPTSAKYKVYIIDEVHMLTREAFNALLKTLEEPPAHVVFILATTDAHKLPETIVSRTQRFTFRPVEKSKVIDHLRQIAKEEKIKVSDEALELLAEHGEGSFRDSISLLDQAGSQGKAVELTDVEQLLGIPSAKALDDLLVAVSNGTSAGLMQSLNKLYEQGFQPAAIAKQLGQSLRQQMISNTPAMDNDVALELMERLIEVPAAHVPERYLELTLLRALPSEPAAFIKPVEKSEQVIEQEVVIPPAIDNVEVSEPAHNEALVQPDLLPTPNLADSKLDDTIWPEVLAVLKKKRNTLYGVVRMATPVFDAEGNLKLMFTFAFHQKRSNESTNRQILADIIKEVTGRSVNIEVVLDAAPKKTVKQGISKHSDSSTSDLSAISNIFGDAKLLES